MDTWTTTEEALPILRSLGAQATFLLPTSFVGRCAVPWWDRIAYLVRHTRKPVLDVNYPGPLRLDIRINPLAALQCALRIYKSPETTHPDRFLAALEEAAEVEPHAAGRLFSNWDEARELAQAGMAIGSHTYSHEVLAKLPAERQYEELRRSRQAIEDALGVTVDTLAFPVGSRTAFSEVTYAALERAEYRAAFSFYGGVNLAGRTEPFNIRRIGVDAGLPHSLFRMRTALATAAGIDLG